MATMTVMSTIATSSFAEGNGRIGVKFYYFGWGDKVYVGDCNRDVEIKVADYEALKSYLVSH